jgi:hypothetical protein
VTAAIPAVMSSSLSNGTSGDGKKGCTAAAEMSSAIALVEINVSLRVVNVYLGSSGILTSRSTGNISLNG